MASRSSTSSSDLLLDASTAGAGVIAGLPAGSGARRRARLWRRRRFRLERWAAEVLRRLPGGAVWAFAIILTFHGLCACILYPRPATRLDLRRKIVALTQESRPCLLIAGDSLAEQQVIPQTLADATGLHPSQVANIAISGCEAAAVAAAFDELRSRFSQEPVMLISVSVFGVNDRRILHLNNESIWRMSLTDRVRLLPARRVVESLFLPEAAVYARLANALSPPPLNFDITGRGIEAEKQSPALPGTPEFSTQSRYVIEWYRNPEIDGVRWGLLEDSLAHLQSRGVQLVLLDSPLNPAFRAVLESESCVETDSRFRSKLRDLSRRLNVPLLSYGTEIFGRRDSIALFHDTVHLNSEGAAILSQIIGRDLRMLFDRGELVFSDPSKRSVETRTPPVLAD